MVTWHIACCTLASVNILTIHICCQDRIKNMYPHKQSEFNSHLSLNILLKYSDYRILPIIAFLKIPLQHWCVTC